MAWRLQSHDSELWNLEELQPLNRIISTDVRFVEFAISNDRFEWSFNSNFMARPISILLSK